MLWHGLNLTIKNNVLKMCKKTFNTGCLFDPYATLLYLSVSTRTAIGQFFGPYFTERTAKFEKP